MQKESETKKKLQKNRTTNIVALVQDETKIQKTNN